MLSDADIATPGATTEAAFDRGRLRLMIAHHQGAVTTAQDVLAATQDPAVAGLAQAVVDGQTQEIDTMKELLAP